MDITALLSASVGGAKPGVQRPGEPHQATTFADHLSSAGNAAEQAQTFSAPDNSQQLDSGKDPAQPHPEMTALAESIGAEMSGEMTSSDAQGLTGFASLPAGALGALLNDNGALSNALSSLPANINMSQLADIQQRMALIEGAGKPAHLATQLPLGHTVQQLTGQPLTAQQLPGQQLPGMTQTPVVTLDDGDTHLLRPGYGSEAPTHASARDARLDARGQLAATGHQPLPANAPQGSALAAAQSNTVFDSEATLLSTLNGHNSSQGGSDSQTAALSAASAAQPSSTHSLSPGQPAPAANTALTLSAPLASQQWQQQLGQQLVSLTQRGDQHVELRLNPAELGPLSISLKLSESGAQAHFLSAHSQVRSALEQAIPQLREALEEQGITLGEAMVGEHSRERQDDEAQLAQGNSQRGEGQTGDATEIPADTTPAQVRDLEGRVDLYA